MGQDGWALEHPSPDLRRNQEVAVAAVGQGVTALEFAAPDLRSEGKSRGVCCPRSPSDREVFRVIYCKYSKVNYGRRKGGIPKFQCRRPRH